MDAIPLHRIAIVLPFTQFLSESGAPVECGFRQAGLPIAALENVNNYVPTQKFWSFVGNMARSEGIEDLGFRVGQRFGASCADPNMASLLSQSPTLHHAILTTSGMVSKTISRSRIGLICLPDGDSAHFFHQPSFDANHPSIDQMDWFGLMALIGIVRQHSHQDAVSTLPHCETVAADFTGSLKQALQTYVQERELAIDFAAELCNTSKRSLQRKPSASNTSYSEVVDQVPFFSATGILRDPHKTVTDVAHYLGYSDSAHFSRAFRRIAGVNPRDYRQQYKHAS